MLYKIMEKQKALPDYNAEGYKEVGRQNGNIANFEDLCKAFCYNFIENNADIQLKQRHENYLKQIANDIKGKIGKKEGRKIRISGLWLVMALTIVLALALFSFYWLTISNAIHYFANPGSVLTGMVIKSVETLWGNFLELPFFLKGISVLFAVLPLVIGYLLYDKREKMELEADVRKLSWWEQWRGFIILLVFVFMLNYSLMTLVYTLSSSVSPLWIGVILFWGFWAYVMWGELLITFLRKYNLKKLKDELREKEKRLSDLERVIFFSRENLKNALIQYEAGVIGFLEQSGSNADTGNLPPLMEAVFESFCVEHTYKPLDIEL